MAVDWLPTSLGSIADFLSGGTPSKVNPHYWTGSVPWLSAKDMKVFRVDDTEDHLSAEGAENGTKLVPAGTLFLLTRGMTLLNDVPISVAQREMAFNQDVKALRARPGVRSDYLAYLLLSLKPRLLEMVDLAGHGTGRLNTDELRAIQLEIPADENEQRAIATILGTFDDKIELNRAMNETLEAIARALFKSWFVDFDPVRAKANGEPPESICRRLSLSPDILALFPDRLVDSGLGEIPEGWEVKALSQVTSYLNRGISPKYLETGGVPVLNQKCVRDGRVDASKARRHDPAQRSIAGRLLEAGDVLVNSTGVGTLGRVGQVLALYETTIVDSHVTVARADPKEISWNYLGVALLQREAEIEALGEGSTGQTELSRVRLGGLRLLVPPEALGMRFDEAVLPLRLHTKRSDEQSLTLASIRDALLPKLLSGELRVPPEGAV